jgi:hypothetical protein
MEMKQKRPRIPQRSNPVDRQENNVFDNVTTDNKPSIEDRGRSKSKLPDIEMEEVSLKEDFDPVRLTDFQVVTDIEPIGISKENLDISTTNDLKDIYNSIQLDDPF